MSIPRMRTAQGVLDEIKVQDPDTEITLNYVRRAILSGIVPVVHVGHKKLVNVDLFMEALGRDLPDVSQPGVIRKVVNFK